LRRFQWREKKKLPFCASSLRWERTSEAKLSGLFNERTFTLKFCNIIKSDQNRETLIRDKTIRKQKKNKNKIEWWKESESEESEPLLLDPIFLHD
jgi:hypothetical protein